MITRTGSFVAVTLALLNLAFPLAHAHEKHTRASGKAELINSQGKVIGSAAFRPVSEGVKVRIALKGLSPGKHGVHVHETGQCNPPDFKSAGAHFNPGRKKHSEHLGDLGNVLADTKGQVFDSIILRGVNLDPDDPNSLFREGGTALVVHAGEDDLRTDPAGNSGERVACGVILRAR